MQHAYETTWSCLRNNHKQVVGLFKTKFMTLQTFHATVVQTVSKYRSALVLNLALSIISIHLFFCKLFQPLEIVVFVSS